MPYTFHSLDLTELNPEVSLTNVLPPIDLWKLLGSQLKTELMGDVVGKTVVDYSNFDNNKIFYKNKSVNYQPKITKYIDINDSKTYSAYFNKVDFNISGAFTIEMDFLLHEVQRYLSTIYPDQKNFLYLYTKEELFDAFNECSNMLGFYIDYNIFESLINSFIKVKNKELSNEENEVLFQSFKMITTLAFLRDKKASLDAKIKFINLLGFKNHKFDLLHLKENNNISYEDTVAVASILSEDKKNEILYNDIPSLLESLLLDKDFSNTSLKDDLINLITKDSKILPLYKINENYVQGDNKYNYQNLVAYICKYYNKILSSNNYDVITVNDLFFSNVYSSFSNEEYYGILEAIFGLKVEDINNSSDKYSLIVAIDNYDEDDFAIDPTLNINKSNDFNLLKIDNLKNLFCLDTQKESEFLNEGLRDPIDDLYSNYDRSIISFLSNGKRLSNRFKSFINQLSVYDNEYIQNYPFDGEKAFNFIEINKVYVDHRVNIDDNGRIVEQVQKKEIGFYIKSCKDNSILYSVVYDNYFSDTFEDDKSICSIPKKLSLDDGSLGIIYFKDKITLEKSYTTIKYFTNQILSYIIGLKEKVDSIYDFKSDKRLNEIKRESYIVYEEDTLISDMVVPQQIRTNFAEIFNEISSIIDNNNDISKISFSEYYKECIGGVSNLYKTYIENYNIKSFLDSFCYTSGDIYSDNDVFNLFTEYKDTLNEEEKKIVLQLIKSISYSDYDMIIYDFLNSILNGDPVSSKNIPSGSASLLYRLKCLFIWNETDGEKYIIDYNKNEIIIENNIYSYVPVFSYSLKYLSFSQMINTIIDSLDIHLKVYYKELDGLDQDSINKAQANLDAAGFGDRGKWKFDGKYFLEIPQAFQELVYSDEKVEYSETNQSSDIIESLLNKTVNKESLLNDTLTNVKDFENIKVRINNNGLYAITKQDFDKIVESDSLYLLVNNSIYKSYIKEKNKENNSFTIDIDDESKEAIFRINNIIVSGIIIHDRFSATKLDKNTFNIEKSGNTISKIPSTLKDIYDLSTLSTEVNYFFNEYAILKSPKPKKDLIFTNDNIVNFISKAIERNDEVIANSELDMYLNSDQSDNIEKKDTINIIDNNQFIGIVLDKTVNNNYFNDKNVSDIKEVLINQSMLDSISSLINKNFSTIYSPSVKIGSLLEATNYSLQTDKALTYDDDYSLACYANSALVNNYSSMLPNRIKVYNDDGGIFDKINESIDNTLSNDHSYTSNFIGTLLSLWDKALWNDAYILEENKYLRSIWFSLFSDLRKETILDPSDIVTEKLISELDEKGALLYNGNISRLSYGDESHSDKSNNGLIGRGLKGSFLIKDKNYDFINSYDNVRYGEQTSNPFILLDEEKVKSIFNIFDEDIQDLSYKDSTYSQDFVSAPYKCSTEDYIKTLEELSNKDIQLKLFYTLSKIVEDNWIETVTTYDNEDEIGGGEEPKIIVEAINNGIISFNFTPSEGNISIPENYYIPFSSIIGYITKIDDEYTIAPYIPAFNTILDTVSTGDEEEGEVMVGFKPISHTKEGILFFLECIYRLNKVTTDEISGIIKDLDLSESKGHNCFPWIADEGGVTPVPIFPIIAYENPYDGVTCGESNTENESTETKIASIFFCVRNIKTNIEGQTEDSAEEDRAKVVWSIYKYTGDLSTIIGNGLKYFGVFNNNDKNYIGEDSFEAYSPEVINEFISKSLLLNSQDSSIKSGIMVNPTFTNKDICKEGIISDLDSCTLGYDKNIFKCGEQLVFSAVSDSVYNEEKNAFDVSQNLVFNKTLSEDQAKSNYICFYDICTTVKRYNYNSANNPYWLDRNFNIDKLNIIGYNYKDNVLELLISGDVNTNKAVLDVNLDELVPIEASLNSIDNYHDNVLDETTKISLKSNIKISKSITNNDTVDSIENINGIEYYKNNLILKGFINFDDANNIYILSEKDKLDINSIIDISSATISQISVFDIGVNDIIKTDNVIQLGSYKDLYNDDALQIINGRSYNSVFESYNNKASSVDEAIDKNGLYIASIFDKSQIKIGHLASSGLKDIDLENGNEIAKSSYTSKTINLSNSSYKSEIVDLYLNNNEFLAYTIDTLLDNQADKKIVKNIISKNGIIDYISSQLYDTNANDRIRREEIVPTLSENIFVKDNSAIGFEISDNTIYYYDLSNILSTEEYNESYNSDIPASFDSLKWNTVDLSDINNVTFTLNDSQSLDISSSKNAEIIKSGPSFYVNTNIKALAINRKTDPTNIGDSFYTKLEDLYDNWVYITSEGVERRIEVVDGEIVWPSPDNITSEEDIDALSDLNTQTAKLAANLFDSFDLDIDTEKVSKSRYLKTIKVDAFINNINNYTIEKSFELFNNSLDNTDNYIFTNKIIEAGVELVKSKIDSSSLTKDSLVARTTIPIISSFINKEDGTKDVILNNTEALILFDDSKENVYVFGGSIRDIYNTDFINSDDIRVRQVNKDYGSFISDDCTSVIALDIEKIQKSIINYKYDDLVSCKAFNHQFSYNLNNSFDKSALNQVFIKAEISWLKTKVPEFNTLSDDEIKLLAIVGDYNDDNSVKFNLKFPYYNESNLPEIETGYTYINISSLFTKNLKRKSFIIKDSIMVNNYNNISIIYGKAKIDENEIDNIDFNSFLFDSQLKQAYMDKLSIDSWPSTLDKEFIKKLASVSIGFCSISFDYGKSFNSIAYLDNDVISGRIEGNSNISLISLIEKSGPVYDVMNNNIIIGDKEVVEIKSKILETKDVLYSEDGVDVPLSSMPFTSINSNKNLYNYLALVKQIHPLNNHSNDFYYFDQDKNDGVYELDYLKLINVVDSGEVANNVYNFFTDKLGNEIKISSILKDTNLSDNEQNVYKLTLSNPLDLNGIYASTDKKIAVSIKDDNNDYYNQMDYIKLLNDKKIDELVRSKNFITETKTDRLFADKMLHIKMSKTASLEELINDNVNFPSPLENKNLYSYDNKGINILSQKNIFGNTVKLVDNELNYICVNEDAITKGYKVEVKDKFIYSLDSVSNAPEIIDISTLSGMYVSNDELVLNDGNTIKDAYALNNGLLILTVNNVTELPSLIKKYNIGNKDIITTYSISNNLDDQLIYTDNSESLNFFNNDSNNYTLKLSKHISNLKKDKNIIYTISNISGQPDDYINIYVSANKPAVEYDEDGEIISGDFIIDDDKIKKFIMVDEGLYISFSGSHSYTTQILPKKEVFNKDFDFSNEHAFDNLNITEVILPLEGYGYIDTKGDAELNEKIEKYKELYSDGGKFAEGFYIPWYEDKKGVIINGKSVKLSEISYNAFRNNESLFSTTEFENVWLVDPVNYNHITKLRVFNNYKSFFDFTSKTKELIKSKPITEDDLNLEYFFVKEIEKEDGKIILPPDEIKNPKIPYFYNNGIISIILTSESSSDNKLFHEKYFNHYNSISGNKVELNLDKFKKINKSSNFVDLKKGIFKSNTLGKLLTATVLFKSQADSENLIPIDLSSIKNIDKDGNSVTDVMDIADRIGYSRVYSEFNFIDDEKGKKVPDIEYTKGDNKLYYTAISEDGRYVKTYEQNLDLAIKNPVLSGENITLCNKDGNNVYVSLDKEILEFDKVIWKYYNDIKNNIELWNKVYIPKEYELENIPNKLRSYVENDNIINYIKEEEYDDPLALVYDYSYDRFDSYSNVKGITVNIFTGIKKFVKNTITNVYNFYKNDESNKTDDEGNSIDSNEEKNNNLLNTNFYIDKLSSFKDSIKLSAINDITTSYIYEICIKYQDQDNNEAYYGSKLIPTSDQTTAQMVRSISNNIDIKFLSLKSFIPPIKSNKENEIKLIILLNKNNEVCEWYALRYPIFQNLNKSPLLFNRLILKTLKLEGLSETTEG